MFSYSRVVQGLVPLPPEPGQLTSVFRCRNERGEPVLAMRISCRNAEEAKTYVQRQSSASSLMHPNISEVKVVLESPSPNEHYVFTVTEYLERSLQKEYNEKLVIRSQWYAEDELWSYFEQLRSALAYMQERGLAHRNIAPSAIRLAGEGRLKLSDFSRVKQLQQSNSLHTVGGEKYQSPTVRRALVQGETDMGKVEHDPFKSDVYSLGVVLLQLTILDLPEALGNIKGLKEVIERLINTDERVTRYSAKWRKALSLMLTIEEELRPNFLDLQEQLENPTAHFEDEMTLEAHRERNHKLLLQLQYGVTCVQLESRRNAEFPCLLTVSVNPQNFDYREVAIDLVCVVDESGSMCEMPMALARSALRHVLTLLGARDRMTVVGFSDTARAMSALTACTQEGKEKLTRIVDELETLDATNATAGVQLAISILKKRRMRKNSAVILILTDCIENLHEDAYNQLKTAKESIPQLSINCICVGAQAPVSPEFSAIGRLEAALIASDVQPAVERTLPLAEEFSEVSLAVRAEAVHGCSLSAVYSEDGKSPFVLGRLAKGQTAHCVFKIQIAPSDSQKILNCSPVTVTASFTVSWHTLQSPMELKSQITEQHLSENLRILPAPSSRSVSRQPMPEEISRKVTSVHERWYRAKASGCLRKARQHAERGQYEEALKVLQHGLEDAESEQYSSTPQVQVAIRDMTSALDFVRDRDSWSHYKHQFLALQCAKSLYLDA